MELFAHANQCHPDIVFTHSYGKSVAFLYVQASIQEDRIVTDLYEKPTNTHQYLLPSSNHPPHVHRNLPYGLGIRIRTFISEQETLGVRLNELSTFLRQRGYSASLVNSQLDRVRAKSRDSILNRSQHSEPARNDKRVPLVCTWNSCLPSLQPILQKTFPILRRNERLKGIFDLPLVSYRQPKNLRDILVHTKPAATQLQERKPGTQPDTYPCGSSSRCKTCAIVKNLTVVITGGNTYTIRWHFNCQSVSVIYLITCTVCTVAYVGKTGCSLRERLNGHRHAIKEKEDTPVGLHFQEKHPVRVSVLASAPNDTTQRRLMEKVWIEQLSSPASPWHLINRDRSIDALTLDLP